jgi:predicted XRE-type DNA-binding protein/DNA-binding transcriptional regulator YiaG
MGKALVIQKGSDNVFRDLGFSESEAQLLLLKSDLAMRICKAIDKLDLSPAKAAKHVGLTLARLKELTTNRSNVFTLEELITIVGRLGYSVKLKMKKTELKHQKQTTKKLAFKSDAFKAIHSSAKALHKTGVINTTTMKGLDATVVKKSNPKSRLMPSPKELDKALALSARQARALATAYGVKVPNGRGRARKLAGNK